MTQQFEIPGFKSYRLEGDQLIAARSWVVAAKENLEEIQAMQADFKRQHEQMTVRQKVTMKALWARLSSMTGLDPEETWESNQWLLETAYLEEHGFAFLLQFNSPQEPEAARGVMDAMGETRH